MGVTPLEDFGIRCPTQDALAQLVVFDPEKFDQPPIRAPAEVFMIFRVKFPAAWSRILSSSRGKYLRPFVSSSVLLGFTRQPESSRRFTPKYSPRRETVAPGGNRSVSIPMKLTYYGHACFAVEAGGKRSSSILSSPQIHSPKKSTRRKSRPISSSSRTAIAIMSPIWWRSRSGRARLLSRPSKSAPGSKIRESKKSRR